MAISLGKLATQFGCELIGDPDIEVSAVATLAGAGPGTIGFLANPSYRKQLKSTAAAAVILKAEDAEGCPAAALIAENPYATFARIAAELHPPKQYEPGIHSGAIVSPSATVADSAHVAALAVIGDDAEIGDGAYIGPGCIVGERCVVGASARIMANATLVQDVRVGQRSIVHSGAVIGADGFGNAMTESGWLKVPQVGGVDIGDDVEIGANTTVDRGAIDDTVIGNGARLDNLIQIGHNVRIGEHTAIAASAAVSGSVTIGKRCMVAGRVGIAGHVVICDDVVLGGAAVVTKDITEPGYYSGAFAAEKDRIWKRRVARFRRLEDLVRRVDALEKVNKNNER